MRVDRQTDKQTNRHTHHNTSHPSRGKVKLIEEKKRSEGSMLS